MTDKPLGVGDVEEATRDPVKRRNLGVWGVAASLIYCVGFFLVFDPDIIALRALPLNEVGDFLAGVAAPLAFFWLVLGFFQQGVELRNSADALQLQGRELHHSVEQQRQLVEVTREQLRFDAEMLAAQQQEIARSSQPLFRIEPRGSSGSGNSRTRAFGFYVRNIGRSCSDFQLWVGGKKARSAGTLETGDFLKFDISASQNELVESEVHVDYIDARNVSGRADFKVKIDQWTVSVEKES